MTQDELVNNAWLLFSGKEPEFSSTDAKYKKVVSIANMKIGDWETETFWDSLYEPRRLVGTVSSTNTYELDDDIREISDTDGDAVEIEHTDGNKTYFSTVTPDNLKNHNGQFCAKAGNRLIFNKYFRPTDVQFGGQIFAPVYLYAERLTSPRSVVPVDDPNWLVKIVAAELSRVDVLKQNQYANLVNEANDLMQNMKEANLAQVSEVLRTWTPGGVSW